MGCDSEYMQYKLAQENVKLKADCNFLHGKNLRLDNLLHDRDEEVQKLKADVARITDACEKYERGYILWPAVQEALSATASSDAWLKERDAKVLEDMHSWLEHHYGVTEVGKELQRKPPFQPKLGFMRTEMGDHAPGWRIWWLWFAITYSPLSDYEYQERLRHPDCVWVGKEKS